MAALGRVAPGRGGRALLASATWVAAWTLAWAAAPIVPGVSAWPRVALALGLVIVPGACASRLLSGRSEDAAVALPTGFALSLTLIGLVGAAGSLLHLSFATCAWIFVALGAVLVFAAVGARADADDGEPSPGPRPGRRVEQVALLVGLAALLVGARLGFDPGLRADDLTEVARTFDFETSEALGVDARIVAGGETTPPRYWLAFWPLAKAFAARVSGVDPLPLTALYLPPFLVVLALLAVFALARRAGAARPLAWFAVAAHLGCLAILPRWSEVGGVVLQRCTQDKVVAAVVLTPVALGLALEALADGGWRNAVRAVLAGLALTLVHGASLAVAALIVGTYALVHGVAAGRWRRVVLLFVALVILVAPQASMRLVAHTMTDWIDSGLGAVGVVDPLGRVHVLPGGTFYGIPFGRVASVPFLLVALAALAALRGLARPGVATARIALAYALVLACAVVPYTGWILGSVLAPLILWRVAWFAPFGIAALALAQWALQRLVASDARRALWTNAATAVVVAGTVLGARLVPPEQRLPGMRLRADWERNVHLFAVPRGPSDARVAFADLAAMGRRLDELTGGAVVVMGAPTLNDLLPSVSARARMVAYRDEFQAQIHGELSADESRERRRGWKRALSADASAQERWAVFDRHAVEYLVLAGRPDWFGDLERPGVGVVHQAGDLVLVDLRAPAAR